MNIRDAMERRAAINEELRRWNRVGAEAGEQLQRLWGDLSNRKLKRREALRAKVEEAQRKIEELCRERRSILMDADD